MANPDKEGSFKWKAVQTYDNGDVVKWDGKEDSEHPAPITTVKKVLIQMVHIVINHQLQVVVQLHYG